MSGLNIEGSDSRGDKNLSHEEIKGLIRDEIHNMTAVELCRQLIKRLHFAIQKVEMYGSSHPIAVDAANQGFFFLQEFLNRQPNATLTLSKEGKILVDDIPMPDDYFTHRFAKDFDHHNIVSMTFFRGIEFREMTALIHFLERRIGAKYRKEDIEEYFAKEKVIHIGVNKFKYEIIRNDELDTEKNEFAKKEKLTGLITDFPEIFKNIFSEDSADMDLDKISSQKPEDEIKSNFIDQVIQTFHRKIIGKDASEQDKLIHSIIEELQATLSEHEKERLRKKLEAIRDEMILDSRAGTSMDIEDSRKMKKLHQFREFEDSIENLLSNPDIQEAIKKLKAILYKIFPEAELAEVDHIYDSVRQRFSANPNPNLLASCESIVDVLFEKCSNRIVNQFVESRMSEKRREREPSPDTPFRSEVLFWILANFVKMDKTMASLQMIKMFDERRYDANLDDDLIEDAENFFYSVIGSSVLCDLVEDIDHYDMDMPEEMREILRILDSEKVAEVILDKSEKKGANFPVIAADGIKANPKNPAVVFAKHVKEISNIRRKPLGELPDAAAKKRARAAIIGLAIVAGEAGISFLELNIDDPDPDVKRATVDAISRIPSKKAVSILVRQLYTSQDWESNLEKFLTRMDIDYAVPMLVKFFHLRKDKWIEIIRVLGKLGGNEAKRFLLDTLDTWSFYTATLADEDSEIFILNLLEAISRLMPDEESLRALKLFKSEWRNDNLLKSIFGVFGKDGDRVTRKVNTLINIWKDELKAG
ncbi:MAG: hypothetical protein ACP5G4_06630 [bacterium]